MATARRKSTPPSAPADDLDLDRVMPHHRAAWRVERIAWALGAIALLGALLGLFGYGPLSRVTVGHADGLQVEYDRFQRSSAPTDYEVTANAALARDGQLRLRFDQTLVDGIEFEDIAPAPEHARAGNGYIEFVFNMAPGHPTRTRITFRFRPTTFGHRSGRVAANGAPPVTLDQYIYP